LKKKVKKLLWKKPRFSTILRHIQTGGPMPVLLRPSLRLAIVGVLPFQVIALSRMLQRGERIIKTFADFSRAKNNISDNFP
jgi:hypothetical protein